MRGWIVAGLVLCLACSDGSVRSGGLPETADFLPMAGEGAEPDSTLEPRMILRCEQGRLGAYLILETPGEPEPEPNDPRAVAVELDSAPAC